MRVERCSFPSLRVHHFVREIEAFEYTLDRSIRNQPTSDSSGLSKKVVIRHSEASRESESCAPKSTLVCNQQSLVRTFSLLDG